MSLASNVASVFLTSDPIPRARLDRIDFYFGRLHIDAQGLRTVGSAIRRGRIQVRVGNTGPLLGAAYSSHHNRMTVPSARAHTTTLGQAAILHEGVHALLDLTRFQTTALTDETAAYLAEAIYLRAASTMPVSRNPDTMRIYRTAFQLINQHLLANRRGVRLRAADYQPLLDAIHNHQAYRGISPSQPNTGLGVP